MEKIENKKRNPIAEYLLKLQLIVTNTEFKDKAEARRYETVESKLNGDKYCRAVNKTDIFESYEYDGREVYSLLSQAGFKDEMIFKYIKAPEFMPQTIKTILLERKREEFIASYEEPNSYYRMLAGLPPVNQRSLTIPDEFYEIYKRDYAIYRDQPVHELPQKYLELFMNSSYYTQMMKDYPNDRYLKYIGSNKIDIVTARTAKDGDILRINAEKLSTYHSVFGNVTVSPDIIHAFTHIYNETRDYVYYTLRGEFSHIYVNYDSFIRFLTIYLSIGNAVNEFVKKSSKLIYMNNTTADNLFTLYGLPSVIMSGASMIEFLKKFRMLLADKGTNIVYRVKDLIGYEYTDIYTLIMVKQQVYEDGIPLYDDDGKTPKQRIVFRRFGTTDDNTSYFNFREEHHEYSLEEITSGDPRWWNTKEVEQIIQEANYTLSNSKYIQLSTNVSMSDIWWECVILLRGLLDRHQETSFTDIEVNFNVNGDSKMRLFDAVLVLVILMNWQLKDTFGQSLSGDMYIPNGTYNGKACCIDMLFNGLAMAKPFEIGRTYNQGDVIGIKDQSRYINTEPIYDYPNPTLYDFHMENIYIASEPFTADESYQTYINQGILVSLEKWDEAAPNDLTPGLPYKVTSFNFDIRSQYPEFYESIKEMDYIEPDTFIPMLENVLNMKNNNVGEILMKDAKMIYKYLEQKLQQSTTIREFRQVTDIFNHLFLVDPVRDWSNDMIFDIENAIVETYEISLSDYHALQMFLYDPHDNPDFKMTYGGIEYPISLYDILTKDTYNLEINGHYPFRDNNFVTEFEAALEVYNNPAIAYSDMITDMKPRDISSSELSLQVKEHYKEIIVYKVKCDLGNTIYGPTSFETMLLRENPSLHNFLINLKSTPESLIIFLRAIIKGLENYTDSDLGALKFKALGIDNYFYILKEVISYFKSYMVEYTKEEFTYIFDGLFDLGGNSNMLRLYDGMPSGTIEIHPNDSLTLYDVSCANIGFRMIDEGFIGTMHDEAIFRLQGKYEDLVASGYTIWYDNGKRITKTNPGIDNSDIVTATFVNTEGAYNIIIPTQTNVKKHYVGNTRP